VTCQPVICLGYAHLIYKIRAVSGDVDNPAPMLKSVDNLRDVMQSNYQETKKVSLILGILLYL
jgi:hypothetical protein